MAAGGDDFGYLLPSSQGEKHRRAPNWTDGEMKALLYVWEENHQQLKTSKRNAKVYERMSQRFFQLTGEQRFKEEIKMKITNMSFQYRRLKSVAAESGEAPDWPYYKFIEKILAKPPVANVANVANVAATPPAAAGGPGSWAEPRPPSGAGTSWRPDPGQPSAPSDEAPAGFLPEYAGSSDEMEIKQESDSGSSDSEPAAGSGQRSHAVARKQKRGRSGASTKRRKLQLMQAMLRQQKRSNRAVEDTCREVRRALHQQNLLQVQCMQLQERMMNLLEKMILPSTAAHKNQLAAPNASSSDSVF
ncbi:myb/SANT-like DNA-binding domain-containing protein 1 [Stigmatopora nigra]